MGNLALQKLSLRIHSLHPYRRIRERLPLQRRDPETPRMRKRIRQTYLATGNRRRRRTTLRRSRVRRRNLRFSAPLHLPWECPNRAFSQWLTSRVSHRHLESRRNSKASRVLQRNHPDQTTKPEQNHPRRSTPRACPA